MNTRDLGLIDYAQAFSQMRAFTDARQSDTDDEIWFCQHPPVFTQGLAGKADHVRDVGDIPIVPSNRGGQVTYHGPGQWVAYILYDLRRAGVNVRELVTLLETAVINLLAELDIVANGDPQARGVYVDGCKIAAMGLRVSRGRSYHGLSLNADMNLAPFSGINPCGYEGLAVTSIAELLGDRCPSVEAVGALLVRHLQDVLPSPT